MHIAKMHVFQNGRAAVGLGAPSGSWVLSVSVVLSVFARSAMEWQMTC